MPLRSCRSSHWQRLRAGWRSGASPPAAAAEWASCWVSARPLDRRPLAFLATHEITLLCTRLIGALGGRWPGRARRVCGAVAWQSRAAGVLRGGKYRLQTTALVYKCLSLSLPLSLCLSLAVCVSLCVAVSLCFILFSRTEQARVMAARAAPGWAAQPSLVSTEITDCSSSLRSSLDSATVRSSQTLRPSARMTSTADPRRRSLCIGRFRQPCPARSSS